ncbi:hypothetical protein T09_1028 [Trichinella sp. T9]|nr:hypothetical protein T09_1028 [Trichinella sp. T9]
MPLIIFQTLKNCIYQMQMTNAKKSHVSRKHEFKLKHQQWPLHCNLDIMKNVKNKLKTNWLES